MDNQRLVELQELAAAVKKQLDDAGAGSISLNELVGKPYAEWLAKLTDLEAIDYLKNVDDDRLLHAYLILLRRLNPSVLAEACLRLMARPETWARRLGAGDIGVLLQGTCSEKGSQALALIIRNPGERDDVRLIAYSSLELINNKVTALECLRRSVNGTRTSDNMLEKVDWGFVDSFIQ